MAKLTFPGGIQLSGEKQLTKDAPFINLFPKDWQDKKITARQAMRLLNLKPNSFYKLAKQYSSE